MKTRRAFIKEVVKTYKKNHPEEYKNFLKLIKYRRKLLRDRTIGFTRDRKGRVSVGMPEQLHQMLYLSVTDPPFLIEDKELKWFSKTYPQFLIPYEY